MSARDSVRLADIKSIEKWLNIKIAKAEKIPLPDDKIDITASWTLITYQGYAGQKVLGNIEVHWGGIDPFDNTYYTYSTNLAQNKYQLLVFFESSDFTGIINNTFADLNQRYPKVYGKNLGIVLDVNTKNPIHYNSNNIDILESDSGEYNFIVNNTSEGDFIWSGSIAINKWSDSLDAHSCEEILSHFSPDYLENKNYPIISNIWEEIEVFCDMKHWGYTGLFSVNPADTTWAFDSTQWVVPTIKENNFLTEETTLESYSYFNTNSVKICRSDLDHCYTMNHNKNIALRKFYTDNLSYIESSKFQYLNSYSGDHSYNNNNSWPNNIWNTSFDNYFISLGLSNVISYIWTTRYSKYWLWINIYPRNRLWYQADNNNTWPSFDNFSVWIWGFAPYSNWTTSCIWWYPHPYNAATSIHISWQDCYIENPDTDMWYVLWK
jgi:hypothetical protein